MPPNIQQVLQDPKFLNLPPAEQGTVLKKVDPRFAALPEAEQGKVLSRLSAQRPPKASPMDPPPSAPAATTATQSSLGEEAAHAAGVFGSGFNKGLSQTLGTPVDLVNAGLKAVGLPMSDTPFMGSEFIQRYLMPEPVQPEGPNENIIGRVGQEVGATAPFIGGSLMMRAQQLAEQGTGVVNKMVADLQAIEPGKLARVETALAASGGFGAGVLNEIFPEGGWMSDFVGEVVGSLGPTAALGVIRKARSTIAAIPEKLGFKSEETLKEDLGQKLVGLGRSSKVAEGIEKADALKETIPGFQPTTGQASGEPGLIQAERSFARSGAEAAQKTATQRLDNQTAIRSAVDEVAPQGKLGDVAAGIEKERARKELLLDKGLARAQAEVDAQRNLITGRTQAVVDRTERMMQGADARAVSRIQALEAKLTPQQQGQIIRQEYGKELEAYQAAANAKYAKVDQSIILPPTGTREAAKKVRAELRTQEADEFIPSGALADMERLGVREEVTQKGPMAKVQKVQREVDVPFGELDALKRRLQGEIRAAKNDTVKRRLNILLDGVESDLDQLTDNPAIKAAHPEAAQAYDEARNFSRAGIFRLKSGEADAIRQLDRTGRNKVGNDAIAQRFLDGEDSIDDFVAALGSRPAAQTALEDAAKLDFYAKAVDPSTGMIHAKAADKWMRDHAHITKQFPDLKAKLESTTELQRSADDIRQRGKAILKDPEARARMEDPRMFDKLDKLEQHAAQVAQTVKRTKASWEKNAASLFLSDDADRAAERILASQTPQTKINQVIGQLGNDPVARKGFERAMWDAALSKFESKAVDALDRPILQARNMKEFLGENRQWMEPLFGKARVDRMEKASEALEMVERSGRVVLPGGSDTAANLTASLSDLGPFLSRLYAHQRGVVSLKWIMGERVARALGGHLQKVTEDKAAALLNEAFFNPEVAHSLMLAAKGGNDELIKKRFRFHLANMNQLDGEDAE
jgi:hypothetical protein